MKKYKKISFGHVAPGALLNISACMHFFITRFLLCSLLLIKLPTLHAQPLDVLPYAPELFPPTVSGAVCGFSKNGNTIYFIREDTIQKKLFLWQAEKKVKQWSSPRLMPFSGKHNDVGGRLTADGKTFYFTSDRPGGSSKEGDAWNIWVSHVINRQWTEPVPLTSLNNKGMECCPVPVSDSNLLFSADRAKTTSWWISSYNSFTGTEIFADTLNLEKTWQWPSSIDETNNILFLNSMGRIDTKGMDDIYISFKNNGAWGRPLNIGAPVNTTAYEDGAILSPDKKYLIFCRHNTAQSPSRVMYIQWDPLRKELNNLRK